VGRFETSADAEAARDEIGPERWIDLRYEDLVARPAEEVTAILRFTGLRFGFPHTVARPDEEVIVDTALGVLRDPNPHFFDWPSLFIYVLSFVFIAIYWNNHHHLLRATTRISGAVMWANMLLLFCLSLIPVVTEWLTA